MLEWDDLKYFLGFARTGSMMAAAKALRVNQSTVHRRVAELEEYLGRKLLERHRGGYRLTALGEDLRPAAEDVEAAVAALERRIAARDPGPTGVLRLTCGSFLASRIYRAQLIDAFQFLHPGLRVELEISDRFLDLSKGEADVAIRIGEPRDDALIGRKIGEAPWAVYASKTYVACHGRPTSTDDIQYHRVIAPGEAIAHHTGALWLQSVAPEAVISTRSDTWPGLVLAAKSGAGLTALLAFQGDSESELVRAIDNAVFTTPYYLVMHRDLQQAARVRAFADFVTSEIRSFRALFSSEATANNYSDMLMTSQSA